MVHQDGWWLSLWRSSTWPGPGRLEDSRAYEYGLGTQLHDHAPSPANLQAEKFWAVAPVLGNIMYQLKR